MLRRSLHLRLSGMLASYFVVALLIAVGSCRAQYAEFRSKDYATGKSWVSLLNGEVKGHRIEAHFFHASTYELCIVDEGDGNPIYGNLEAAMSSNSCVAGINGGYFAANPTRTPLGLLRHASRGISPLSTGSFTVAGTLYDTGENIFLERSASLRVPQQRMREAIQGGPFLVEQFRVVPGLERTRKAMRTFIATDGAGVWCLAITSPLTLRELANILCSPNSLGSFRVRMALNMDGGSSSAFWDSTANIYRQGFKSVRNYIGIRPRKKHASSPKRSHLSQ